MTRLFVFHFLLFTFAILTTEKSLGSVQVESRANACAVTDLNTLTNCFENFASYDSIEFHNDISCHGDECCPEKKTALIEFGGVQNKTVFGNGHKITRFDRHRKCGALFLYYGKSVTIQDLKFDENEQAKPCSPDPDDKCPGTVGIYASENVNLERVEVYHAKATAIWGIKTTGLSINQSVVANTGILGIYVGDNSRYISVKNSIFSRVRTNAVAYRGVFGKKPGDNVIENNVFTMNHYQGMWLVHDPRSPYHNQPITGGMIYVPNANFVRISGNVLGDGACPSCGGSPEIHGIELGAVPNEGPLKAIDITNNYFYNIHGNGVYLNYGSSISGSRVINNTFLGVTTLTKSPDNRFGDTVIRNNYMGDANPSLNRKGATRYRIFRYKLKNGLHVEANTRGERKNASLEEVFQLSATPRPGASAIPIYRCFIKKSSQNDFISLEPTCEGQRRFHSILGYSYEREFPQTQPIYACKAKENSDRFISWDANCEGQIMERPLGYALKLNTLFDEELYQ